MERERPSPIFTPIATPVSPPQAGEKAEAARRKDEKGGSVGRRVNVGDGGDGEGHGGGCLSRLRCVIYGRRRLVTTEARGALLVFSPISHHQLPDGQGQPSGWLAGRLSCSALYLATSSSRPPPAPRPILLFLMVCHLDTGQIASRPPLPSSPSSTFPLHFRSSIPL